MFSASRSMKATGLALAMMMTVGHLPTAAVAAPFGTAGAPEVKVDGSIVQVQARRYRPVAQRRRSNNNAAIGAAILGIGVLGIAAAAAASQRDERRGAYYSDQWNTPVDAYGRPLYGQPRQVQYYYEQQYAPRYYRQDPRFYNDRVIDQRYGEPRMNRWQREQFREQARAERSRQRQREYYGQPQYEQPYRGQRFNPGSPGRNIFN